MISEAKECHRCLYTIDHPLGLTLDEEGICSGCRIHEEKDTLDWQERFRLLEKKVAPYCSKTNYDCIVPVSGGMDSYYIVYIVKNRLKLNPLLVTYNKYWNTEVGIKNLVNLRIQFNCDILYQNVNPHSVKKIVRTTLKSFGSIYWHCIAGQTVFPVQVAINRKIPLIIWGAHQGLEQVGMFSHEHEVEMTRRYRKDHDLMGYEADDLLNVFDTLTEEDIFQYRYPSDEALSAVGVRGIYLGNYVRWDPKRQHEKMISKFNFETSAFNRTFDHYDFVDCFNYMNLHDILKLYKHGYSKVTDHASREIRHGRLTREQAIFLVKKYEKKEADHLELFSQWLGMDLRSLRWSMDIHRNPRYWEKIGFREWVFRGISTIRSSSESADSKKLLSYVTKCSTETQYSGTYITIGKGLH